MTTRQLPRRFWLVALAVALLAAGATAAYLALAGTRRNPVTTNGTENPNEDGPPAFSGSPWFLDVTASSGIDFTYRNGEEADQFTILESVGGGVGLIDYDGDGVADVFVVGGGTFTGPDKTTLTGRPCKLYRNKGGCKFEDVTAKVGLDRAWFYTHGVAVADYDRDGWPDLLVTGYGGLALLHNEPDGKGGRRFVDVTAQMGLQSDSWNTSAAFADLDGDGWPDLYVCRYVNWSFQNNPVCEGVAPGVKRDVCPPQRFKPLKHALFRNENGKRFRDVSDQQGFKATGCGLGVLLADFNGDGKPDAYVANDASDNFLFFNRGSGGQLKLEEKGRHSGTSGDEVGQLNGSMGVDVGDYDSSGRASIWVTNFQGELHALYHNLGREVFQHVSRASGVGAIGQHYVGFGTGFIDADNDGWEDLVVANGHVWRWPSMGRTLKQRPVLLRNVELRGRRFFQDAGALAGPFFRQPAVGRGVAIGDLDNDGWPDLIFSHTNSPVAVLRNTASATSRGRWLGFRLRGRKHRDVVGTTVVVECGDRKLTRFVKGGGSYLSANDPRLLIGLGEAGRLGRVTVRWSWGESQTWEGLEAGAYWELVEGEKQATNLPASAR